MTPASPEIEPPAINAHYRTPGESRVDVEDAAERPATCDLFDPAPAAIEEDWLPHAKDLKRLADIVVGASVIQAEVIRVILFKVWPGTCIHTLSPGELSGGHKLLRQLMLQFSEHGVVVSAARTAPEITAADLRIQGQGAGCGDSIRILVKEDITRQASHVSQRRYQMVAEIVLGVQRVVMDTHGRKVRGENVDADLAGCG